MSANVRGRSDALIYGDTCSRLRVQRDAANMKVLMQSFGSSGRVPLFWTYSESPHPTYDLVRLGLRSFRFRRVLAKPLVPRRASEVSGFGDDRAGRWPQSPGQRPHLGRSEGSLARHSFH